MARRELLDCTLRDGGYVNDWQFGHAQIVELFERLVSSGVEYIEIGFLDESQPFDMDRTIFPDTELADKIYAGLDKGKSMVLAMIDYGHCSIEKLQPADSTIIDGIRVIFKEHLMREALAFCRQVQDLGYKVFAQMVSVTTYTDEKLKIYAQECNKLKPFATSMVDTYGLLDEEHLMHIFSILDAHLDPKIRVGYHAHNNFQMGYANAKAFLACGSQRDLLVDGTLYGMGKSAGNAPLELLMMYRNEKQRAQYDVSQVLEAIDNVVLDIYRKQYWGYNLFFYIAASTHCHPSYVSYFMNKRTLSVKRITELLGSLDEGKKLSYDRFYAEKKYQEYQSIACDDSRAIDELAERLFHKEILLIGPGANIKRQQDRVQRFMAAKKPVTIAINYIPHDIKVDAVFLTKSKRYTQMIDDMHSSLNSEAKVIATSNVTRTADDFHYVLSYSSLIDPETEIADNSLVMLLKAMKRCRVESVNLAGFDGYSRTDDNYFDKSFEYSFSREKADYFNEYVKKFINKYSDELYVNFITDSKYDG